MKTTLERTGLIESLNWRYAVKAFDTEQKISEDDLNTLFEVVRMAPTAYGQQPFKVLNIENQEIRNQLKAASYGQEKVANASHLLVFAVDTTLGDKTVDEYLQLASKARNIPVSSMEGFGKVVKATYQQLGEEGRIHWAAKQAYLAMGFLLSAAAQMHIDACPMEGIDPQKYEQILGLKEKGLKAVVAVTLGFRSNEDSVQYLVKVRKPMTDMVEEI